MRTNKFTNEKRYCFNPVKPRTWLVDNLEQASVDIFSLKAESNTEVKDEVEVVGFSASDFLYLKINHDLVLFNWRNNNSLTLLGYFKKCTPFINQICFQGRSEILHGVDVERKITSSARLSLFMPEYLKKVKVNLKAIRELEG